MDKSKESPPTQADQFKETARRIEADEAEDALDKVMKKLDLKRKPEDTPEEKPE